MTVHRLGALPRRRENAIIEEVGVALPPEGLYRVRQSFKCSANSNMTFQPGQLVQLGYNRRADSILFIPIWDENGLTMPDRGVLMEPENIRYLEQLVVGHAKSDPTQVFH